MMKRLDNYNAVIMVLLVVLSFGWSILFGIVWYRNKRSGPIPSETTVIKQRMTRIEEELFDIERRVINIEQRWIVIENEVFPYDERFGRNEKEE